MPVLIAICTWLENTPVGMFISGSTWAFPTIESIHVFFLVIVVGTIAIVDLRLIGVASKNRSVSQLSNDVLPLTWGAFVMALITGGLLFSSKATHYLANWPFRFKMCLLVLAGLNMVIFHFLTYRDVKKWDDDVVTPTAARIAGALSLCFWIGVVAFGRWIGFTVK
jgi:uncharacterized membrane protein